MIFVKICVMKLVSVRSPFSKQKLQYDWKSEKYYGWGSLWGAIPPAQSYREQNFGIWGANIVQGALSAKFVVRTFLLLFSLSFTTQKSRGAKF